MPRPANPEVRTRLLAAGGQVIHSRGFNGCGVQDITAAAGVPKGSFYNYFDSKEAFAVDLLEEYWSSIETRYFPLLSDLRLKPRTRLDRFFRGLADDHSQHNFTQGCLIGNLSLEMSTDSGIVRTRLLELFRRWEEALAACLREAQATGEIPTNEDAAQLAAMIVEAWEGAALRSKVERSRKPYQRFEQIVMPSLIGS